MKKMKKRILAVILSAACAASLAVPAFADGTASAAAEGEDAPVPEISASADAASDAATTTEPEEAGEMFMLSIKETEHGTMSFYEEEEACRQKEFCPGDPVILSAMPEVGYEVQKVSLVQDEVTEDCTKREDGLYEIMMPGCMAFVEAVFVKAESLPDEGMEADAENEAAAGEDALLGSADEPGVEQAEIAISSVSDAQTEEVSTSSAVPGTAPEEPSEAEEPDDTPESEETKEEAKAESEAEPEEEKPEEKTGDPAASNRLLVKTEDPSVLDEEAVIGVMDDVYLLQYASKEEAGNALASVEDCHDNG